MIHAGAGLGQKAVRLGTPDGFLPAGRSGQPVDRFSRPPSALVVQRFRRVVGEMYANEGGGVPEHETSGADSVTSLLVSWVRICSKFSLRSGRILERAHVVAPPRLPLPHPGPDLAALFFTDCACCIFGVAGPRGVTAVGSRFSRTPLPGSTHPWSSSHATALAIPPLAPQLPRANAWPPKRRTPRAPGRQPRRGRRLVARAACRSRCRRFRTKCHLFWKRPENKLLHKSSKLAVPNICSQIEPRV